MYVRLLKISPMNFSNSFTPILHFGKSNVTHYLATGTGFHINRGGGKTSSSQRLSRFKSLKLFCFRPKKSGIGLSALFEHSFLPQNQRSSDNNTQLHKKVIKCVLRVKLQVRNANEGFIIIMGGLLWKLLCKMHFRASIFKQLRYFERNRGDARACCYVIGWALQHSDWVSALASIWLAESIINSSLCELSANYLYWQSHDNMETLTIHNTK